MQDMNNVNIIGRIVKDATLKNIGDAVLVEFSIVFNNSRKNGHQWEDEASFIGCKYWGNGAKAVHPYLKSGVRIGIPGKLKQERWNDKNTGQKRSAHFLMCTHVQLLDNKKDNLQGQKMKNNVQNVFSQNSTSSLDDDIPF